MLRRVAKSLLQGTAIGLTAAFVALQAFSIPASAATAQQVSDFKNNPAAVLQLAQNKNGGSQLVEFIRDMIMSDGTTLDAIVALLATANNAQQSAIGTGLGQAAQALVTTDAALATRIQTALAGLAATYPTAVAAYSSATGNSLIGATGGGGGAGGGGTGPTGNGPATGGSGGGGSSSTASTGTTNSGNGSTGGPTSTSTGTGTTTVSP